MNMLPIFFVRNWKRPNDDAASFPKIWHRFTAKSKSGQIHNIRIQDMTPDQREDVWTMFLNHFYPDEELHRLLNITEDEESMASEKLVFDHIVQQKLTLVAVLDTEDPKPCIVGCLLLIVISRNDPPLPELPGAAAAKLDKLFSLLRDDIDVFGKLGSEHLLKEFGLVVKPEYRRMNIGTELFKTIERMGNVFRIPAAVIILGNVSSQGLSAKLGFKTIKEIKLSDYKDENGQIILPAKDAKVIQYGYFKYF